jgi:hypothetical protein
MYKLPEIGADMPKHVGVVKGHTFECLQLVHSLGFINEDFTRSQSNAAIYY